jgi:hypothetical protein
VVAAEPAMASEPIVALVPPAPEAAPAEPVALAAEATAPPSRQRSYLALGLAAVLIAGAAGILVLASRHVSAPPATPVTAGPRLTPRPQASQAPVVSEQPAATVAAVPTPAPLTAASPSAPQVKLPPRQPEPHAPPVSTPAAPEEPATAALPGLLAQAEAAASEKKWEAAVSLYDQALGLDPQNAAASAGRLSALAARDLAGRKFVAARTTAETTGAGRGLSGFDTEDVNVKKAPRDSAAIEFDTTPPSPRPGEPYSVRVYLANLGNKPLKIAAITLVVAANAERTGSSVPARIKEVDRGERTLIHEVTGAWRDGTSSWSLTVTVLTQRGDTFRNNLAWR